MDSEISNSSRISFPFEPYPVQSALMAKIYQTLSEGDVGIFESPTGTGKSLSILCSSLQWIYDETERDFSKRLKAEGTGRALEDTKETEKATGLPDWLTGYTSQKSQTAEEKRLEQRRKQEEELEKRLHDVRRGLDPRMRNTTKNARRFQTKKRKVEKLSLLSQDDTGNLETKLPGFMKEDPNELEEYHSDGGTGDGRAKNRFSDDSDEDIEGIREESEEEELETRKIIYCSRTHSQTAQFIRELRKTVFAQSRVVALGSRRLLCVNPEVKQLPSDAQINDECQNLMDGKKKQQKKKSQDRKKNQGKKDGKKGGDKETNGCPYLHKDSQELFRDQMLATAKDIEELAVLGEDSSTCAYFGTRAAVRFAQLVVMPYSMLLLKSARESMGIKLKGNVVIVDEAHNLIEAINNTNGSKITLSELRRAHSQLSQYQSRYASRLKGKNLAYINQILYLSRSLLKFLEAGCSKVSSHLQQSPNPSEVKTSEMLSINEFVFKSKIDNSNMFKILKFMNVSQISKKVRGFAVAEPEVSLHTDDQEKCNNENSKADAVFVRRNVSALSTVQSFLGALTNMNADGKVLASYASGTDSSSPQRGYSEPFLKFVMLNPAVHFQEIVQQAHSVALVGGTMKPLDFLAAQLFSDLSSGRKVVKFSCGHVIPPENLVALAVARGPTGQEFNFTFQRRGERAQAVELGRLLSNVCNQVPGGVVCFLPSYRFEDQLIALWKETNLLQQLDRKKTVFREPRQARDVERVLSQYSVHAHGKKGAILFCVVGAKMSEGINFTDELARCVVMVGLPYADLKDPELMQKMAYFDGTAWQSGFTGRDYYQQICMRAVNQSIGRSIRHAKDFSTILLVDHRYNDPKIQRLLPDWISSRTQSALNFGTLVSSIRRFYNVHKNLEKKSTG